MLDLIAIRKRLIGGPVIVGTVTLPAEDFNAMEAEIERLEKACLKLHAAGCSESERADRLQGIVDAIISRYEVLQNHGPDRTTECGAWIDASWLEEIGEAAKVKEEKS